MAVSLSAAEYNSQTEMPVPNRKVADVICRVWWDIELSSSIGKMPRFESYSTGLLSVDKDDSLPLTTRALANTGHK